MPQYIGFFFNLYQYIVFLSLTSLSRSNILNENLRKEVSMANKETSKRVASTASKILRDKRTSSASKSVAGSALSQTPSKKK